MRLQLCVRGHSREGHLAGQHVMKLAEMHQRGQPPTEPGAPGPLLPGSGRRPQAGLELPRRTQAPFPVTLREAQERGCRASSCGEAEASTSYGTRLRSWEGAAPGEFETIPRGDPLRHRVKGFAGCFMYCFARDSAFITSR